MYIIYKNNKLFVIYKEREKVIYRNHYKEFIKWLPATVVKRLSKLIYVIKVNNGMRRVHCNQIRYPNKKEACKLGTEIINIGNKDKIDRKKKGKHLRRLNREIKKPKRYNYIK